MRCNFTNETWKPGKFLRGLFSPHSRTTSTQAGVTYHSEDAPKKVLVIDDDAVILKTLSMKLKSAGYAVQTAADGSDAIRVMRDDSPDVIVMDINFPPDVPFGGGVPWDGFLLMRWLHTMDRNRKVPVIFITGSASVSYKEQAQASGALNLFQKPIDHSKLLPLIELAVHGKATPEMGTNFQI